MTLKEILQRCNGLKVYEQRSAGDEYAELVFQSKDKEQWDKLFTEILGPAVKPAGQAPSKEDTALTEEHGGVFDNQVLFKKQFGDVTIIAMFWPWQDNEHTTLKIALLKK